MPADPNINAVDAPFLWGPLPHRASAAGHAKQRPGKSDFDDIPVHVREFMRLLQSEEGDENNGKAFVYSWQLLLYVLTSCSSFQRRLKTQGNKLRATGKTNGYLTFPQREVLRHYGNHAWTYLFFPAREVLQRSVFEGGRALAANGM
jgi:hypothetical protein